jgi:hypothetical protein
MARKKLQHGWKWMVFGLLPIASLLYAQPRDVYDSGGVLIPEQAAYDVRFYDLKLTVNPAAKRIDGTATVLVKALQPLSWLVLDLDPLLNVKSIGEIRGDKTQTLAFERRGGQLWINLKTERHSSDLISVAIDYGGKPREAPFAPWEGGFTWSRTKSDKPWIATSCQTEGADIWFPNKDHVSDKPDSVALHITVPKPLVVASNGRLRGIDTNRNNTYTYNWFVSNPISAYNIALNIAPYRHIETEYERTDGSKMAIQFFVLPEDEARGKAFLAEMKDQVAFLENLLGPYPFRADKFAAAQTPFLGMEHQTIIAYGANFRNDAMTDYDGGFDALFFHELAHEWYGNLLTNADWKDMWLHEGFATYLEALYAEHLGGSSAYKNYMTQQRRSIRNDAPLAAQSAQTSKEVSDDVYNKGSWVLHSLRYLIGMEKMKHILRRMAYPNPQMEQVTDGRQTRFVDSYEFIWLVQRVTKQDLNWFFETYLRHSKLPQLHIIKGRKGFTFKWETVSGLAFTMPIEVLVNGQRQRLEMPSGEGYLTIPEGALVLVDPDRWILRDPDKVEEENLAQLKLEAYTGTFQIQPNVAVSVEQEENHLVFKDYEGHRYEMVFVKNHGFNLKDEAQQIYFNVTASNTVDRLEWVKGRQVIQAVKPEFITANDLPPQFTVPRRTTRQLLGTYQSADKVRYVVSQKRGKFYIVQGEMPPVEVFPESEIVFQWRLIDAKIVFQLDDTGKKVPQIVIESNGQHIEANRVE